MMKFLTFTKMHCASLGTIKHFLLHLYNASFKNIIDRNPCMQLHIKIGWKIYSIGHAENRNWSGRTAETFKLFETILELIREDPWEAASALPILRSSIYKICKKLFIFSPTRWCEFINYCLQKVLNKYSSLFPLQWFIAKFIFLCRIVFLTSASPKWPEWWAHRILLFGTSKIQETIGGMKCVQKNKFWHAVHTYGRIDL